MRHFLENWIFDRKSTGAPLQNSENFVLSQNGVRKYFLAKLFVPLIKRNISTTFEGVFGKLNFWRKIDRRGPYKIVKILYYLKWGKKISFGKIICSTHQKKHFYNIWGSFWKIEFLTENRQARTLQNSENFVLSQNEVRKYFLAKLFVPLIKRNISTTFEGGFGKLNFWRKIDRQPLQNSENFVLSQNGVRKYFLAKLFVPLIKRNISTTFKAVFGKLNF